MLTTRSSPAPNFLMRIVSAVACCLFLLVGLHVAAVAQTAPAPAAPASPAQRLDSVGATLDQVERTLLRQDLPDSTLANLRGEVEPLAATVNAVIAQAQPQLDAAKARLDQLGPKPAANAPPESPSVTSDREQQQKQFDDIDALVKRARVLSLRIEQDVAAIAARRQAAFTHALFARTWSILDPRLWIEVGGELRGDLRAIQTVAGDLAANVEDKLDVWQLLILIGTLIALSAAVVIVKHVARRVVRRDPAVSKPSPLRKARAAVWVSVVTACIPIGIVLAVLALLRAFAFDNPRLQPMTSAIVLAATSVSIVVGLVQGLLAPGLAGWRILPLTDASAHRIGRLAVTTVVIVVLTRICEAFAEIIAATLTFSIMLRAIGAGLVALVLGFSLWGSAASDETESRPEAEVGPRRDWFGAIRVAAWTIVVVIVLAILTGYIAFGAFVVHQVVWISFVGSVAYLAINLAKEGFRAGFQPRARFGRMLVSSVGLRRESLEQIATVLAGLVEVALLLVAGLLVLAPWGIASDDMLASARAAFFGFKVGDVSVSLASIAASLAVFALIWGLARAFRHWLDRRFLPLTQLDAGLRNSISTSIGYVGIALAATLALGHLGLSFDKLAIVAGALSVGIGFGLQSIVNNFVSGLILLWERAIRVGDWVVVGDEQGYVRRINVRSTEIETFDRATMIVPNSNLISGVVKNWLRNDRGGRIRIPVSVNLASDPDRVREILVGCARDQDLVVKLPAPKVLFISMSENMLKFELVCFVTDIEQALRVKSDLNFDIFKQFKEAGINPATGAPAISVPGLDVLIDRAARKT